MPRGIGRISADRVQLIHQSTNTFEFVGPLDQGPSAKTLASMRRRGGSTQVGFGFGTHEWPGPPDCWRMAPTSGTTV